MNVFCLVGKLSKKPELTETASGIRRADIEIAVDRSFANCMGIYEKDYITMEVWRGLAETITANGEPGQIVTAKGRIASRDNNGKRYYAFVAERIDLMSDSHSSAESLS